GSVMAGGFGPFPAPALIPKPFSSRPFLCVRRTATDCTTARSLRRISINREDSSELRQHHKNFSQTSESPLLHYYPFKPIRPSALDLIALTSCLRRPSMPFSRRSQRLGRRLGSATAPGEHSAC